MPLSIRSNRTNHVVFAELNAIDPNNQDVVFREISLSKLLQETLKSERSRAEDALEFVRPLRVQVLGEKASD